MRQLILGVLLSAAAGHLAAQEPAWNANANKACDRACRVGVMDGYMNAMCAAG